MSESVTGTHANTLKSLSQRRNRWKKTSYQQVERQRRESIVKIKGSRIFSQTIDSTFSILDLKTFMPSSVIFIFPKILFMEQMQKSSAKLSSPTKNKN